MTTDKKFNFAKSYQELQKIVEWFEKEEIDLEDGIKKFEEGIWEAVKELMQGATRVWEIGLKNQPQALRHYDIIAT